MIRRDEFNLAARTVAADLAAHLPAMINYKRSVQNAVLLAATAQEIEDVRCGRINHGMIDKLCRLAATCLFDRKDAVQLYCAAMAVGTIVKEYDWGVAYITGDGLWEVAQSIHNHTSC